MCQARGSPRMSSEHSDRLYPDLEEVLRNNQMSQENVWNLPWIIQDILVRMWGQTPENSNSRPSAPPAPQASFEENQNHQQSRHDEQGFSAGFERNYYGPPPSYGWTHPPPPQAQNSYRQPPRPPPCSFLGTLFMKLACLVLVVNLPTCFLAAGLFIALARSLEWPVWEALAAGMILHFLMSMDSLLLIFLAVYAFVRIAILKKPLCDRQYWQRHMRPQWSW